MLLYNTPDETDMAPVVVSSILLQKNEAIVAYDRERGGAKEESRFETCCWETGSDHCQSRLPGWHICSLSN